MALPPPLAHIGGCVMGLGQMVTEPNRMRRNHRVSQPPAVGWWWVKARGEGLPDATPATAAGSAAARAAS